MRKFIASLYRKSLDTFAKSLRWKPTPLTFPPLGRPNVLILGIFLGNRSNSVQHLVSRLSDSKYCKVEQKWISLNGASPCPEVAKVTVKNVSGHVPKFKIINQLLNGIDISAVDYLIVIDDDIYLRPNFVDAFIGWQQKFQFALAQPARSRHSYADHPIVRHERGKSGRRTRFVEIGPLFSMHKDVFSELLPFDEQSPMGWGYDFVWPVIIENAGKRMGIIDATPVDHTLRARGTTYAAEGEIDVMAAYLSKNRHLVSREAFVVLEYY